MSVIATETATESVLYATGIAYENVELKPFWDTTVAKAAPASSSLIESINHYHPFSDYLRKGKLPIRRYPWQ